MGLLMRIIHVFPALAGLTVTIILVPITTVVSRRLRNVRKALLKCTDDRVKLVTEVITGQFYPSQKVSDMVLHLSQIRVREPKR